MYCTENPIARAMDLAGTGRFRTASEVRAALKAEGYPQSMIYPVFEGASFLKALRTILKRAARADGAESTWEQSYVTS
jgi:hypothetical protein